jgi:biotin synthase
LNIRTNWTRAGIKGLSFMAGANSIFTGDKLLTAANAGDDKDAELMAKLGLVPMEAEEPLRACRALETMEV